MIHIVFNVDENYKEALKVTAKSILMRTTEQVMFHIIGIDSIEMDGNIKFYPNPDLSMFTEVNKQDYNYFTKAALYRLLIPLLIEEDKAIYLDCDTIVCHDIKELWDIDVDFIGGCKDPQFNFRKQQTKTKGRYYINSGVLLFNLKQIRAKMPDYVEKIINIQNNYKLELIDQDIINHLFDEQITYLDLKWNVCANLCDDKDYTELDYIERDKARENPAIIHYMGSRKPDKYDDISFAEEYDKVIGRFRKYPTILQAGKITIVRR